MTQYVPKQDLIETLADRCETWKEAEAVLATVKRLRTEAYKDALDITSVEWFAARNRNLRLDGRQPMPPRDVILVLEEVSVSSNLTEVEAVAGTRVLIDGKLRGWKRVLLPIGRFARLKTVSQLTELIVDSANRGKQEDVVYMMTPESQAFYNPMNHDTLSERLTLMTASVAKYVEAMEKQA